MNVALERLTHADINLLRELRNANADAFFDDTYITREMQEDWWWRMQRFVATNHFYTIWLNKVKSVGFLSVSFRYHFFVEGCPRVFAKREIGHLLLAPAHRGRGIMHAAITEVRRLYNPLTFWVVHVKSTNTASLKLFARQEFVQYDRTTKPRSKQCRLPKSKVSTRPSSPICSPSSRARSSRTR